MARWGLAVVGWTVWGWVRKRRVVVGVSVRRVVFLSVLGLLAGCSGSDPFGGDHEASYDRLCGEACQGFVELGEHLATIEDEASLESAIPKVRSIVDDMVKAVQRQNEIIAAGYRPSEAIEKKWKAKVAESGESMKEELMRIAGIRGIDMIQAELLRLTKIPRPKVRRPTAPTSQNGRPEISKQMQDDMRTLGRVYKSYSDANRRNSPADWDDAEAFCRQSGNQNGVEALERMRSQGVTVHWGMRYQNAYVGTTDYVFAYEEKTPSEGGLILHLNGKTEAVAPGELMACLAHQVDTDLKTFGRTPPFPVQFPEGTRPTPPVHLRLDMSKGWPPDNPVMPVRTQPVIQPGTYRVVDERPSQSAGQERPSTGGSRPPSLGRDSASSSKSEPQQQSDTPSSFGGQGMPEAPGQFGHSPTAHSGPSAAERMRSRGGSSNPFGRGSSSDVKTVDSPLVGGSSRMMVRRKTDRKGRPMIGVRYAVMKWAGQDGLRVFEPLFERGRPRLGHEELFARDGYAVGAIQVDAGENVNAVRIAFMRIAGNRLNQQDSYVSDWIGNPTGRTPTTVNSNGTFVLGVHFRATAIVQAVGLISKAE